MFLIISSLRGDGMTDEKKNVFAADGNAWALLLHVVEEQRVRSIVEPLVVSTAGMTL